MNGPTPPPLRRDAALLRNWAPVRADLHGCRHAQARRRQTAGRRRRRPNWSPPRSSAVSITNRGNDAVSRRPARASSRSSKRTLAIPDVTVPPGESLWLPLDVSLGPAGCAANASNFSAAERIVYATAELLSIEFENGILAMEFAAPEGGEVDSATGARAGRPVPGGGQAHRVRLGRQNAARALSPFPANAAPGNRVRVGIAMEEPDTSAFFNDARRLIIGQKNLVSTTYSSADVAARSRLRLPEGFTATADTKSPNEIDYEVERAARRAARRFRRLSRWRPTACRWARAHLQLFRPVSIRLMEAMQLHFGPQPN